METPSAKFFYEDNNDGAYDGDDYEDDDLENEDEDVYLQFDDDELSWKSLQVYSIFFYIFSCCSCCF